MIPENTPQTTIPAQRRVVRDVPIQQFVDAVNLLTSLGTDPARVWTSTCPRDNTDCPWQGKTWHSGSVTDLRTIAAINLVHSTMCRTNHTPDAKALLEAEVDHWFPVLTGDPADPAAYTREAAARRIEALETEAGAQQAAAAIVHFDPGYGHAPADLTPEQATDRFEVLARLAWDMECERDVARTDAAEARDALTAQHIEIAAADLHSRLAERRAELGRADVKAGAVAAVVGGGAAMLAQPALALTGVAAIAAGAAAGLAVLTVAGAVTVIWPALAWRGGSDLDDDADADPRELADAARSRAEYAEIRLIDLGQRLTGAANAARAKYRRLRAALISLAATGAAAVTAAILTAIGA